MSETNPVKELKRSSEQCVLNANLMKFVRLYQDRKESPENYSEITGEVNETRTHLSSGAEIAPFLTLTNSHLSSLVPYTRIYKEAKPGELTEFHFDAHHDHAAMTQDMWGRGSGAGITSVSVDMEGDSLATAERQFKVTVKFFFASIEEMFRKRYDGKDKPYTYADIINPSSTFSNKKDPCNETGSNILYKKAHTERFLLKFGYNLPTGESILGESNSEQLRLAIERAQRGIYLNVYKNTVDFNENGTVTLSVEFHGYAERKFINIDVLQMGLTVDERRDKRRDLRRTETAQCKDQRKLDGYKNPSKKPQKPCEPEPPKETEEEKEAREELAEQAEERIKQREKDLASERTKGYRSFLLNLIRVGRVYSYSTIKMDTDTYKLAPQTLDLVGEGNFNKTAHHATQKRYFFFGDLLEGVFKLAKEQRLSVNKFNFMLGSLAYKDPDTKKTSHIPIASLPIAMPLFQEWFKYHVIQKGERVTYNLMDFLRDVLNNLIKNSFTITCFKDVDKTVDNAAIPSMPKFSVDTFETKDDLNGRSFHYSALAKELINPVNIVDPYTNYYIYGVNPPAERTPKTKGTEEADAKVGVYHLVSGREHGLVKSIKFVKEDQKYVTEARMTKSGSDKFGMLRGLYNAEVNMFGNPLFRPGMMVYLASSAYDAHQANAIGLGGYYYVTKVFNSIEDGKFKTELKCKFHHSSKAGGAC